MDIGRNLSLGLHEILSKLRTLGIVRSFVLKIDFREIEDEFKECLLEVDGLLRKCLEKIVRKPRCAEIRNVISELVKKKNTHHKFLYLHPKADLSDGETSPSNVLVPSEKKANNNTSTIDYTCICRKLKNKKCLASHSVNRKRQRKVLCEFCGETFLNLFRLKLHIFKSHNTEGNFKCNYCFRSCLTEDRFRSHVKSHVNNIDSGVVSDHESNAVASSANPSSSAVPCHEVHTCSRAKDEDSKGDIPVDGTGNEKTPSAREFICSFPDCGKIFRLERSLKKHIKLKHSSRGMEFTCKICLKAFAEKGKLNRHALIHDRGQFECSKCCRTFHRKDNLRRHIVYSHGNLKLFECKFCNKQFSIKFNRNEHEKNVHNGEGVTCETCGEKYKNQSTYKIHMKLHEGRPFACTLCPKTFMRKTNYRDHLKSKHKGHSPFQKLFDSFVET